MINKEDFDAWRRDPVTKAVFQAIEEEIEQTQQAMLNPSVIMSAEAQTKLARLLGFCEGLEYVTRVEIGEDEESESARI